jgi:molecular chaperone DnaJ
VSVEASQEEIRSAFRKLALRSHPDHNPDDPLAEERFKCAREAFETLIDPKRRAVYDHNHGKKSRRRGSNGTNGNGTRRARRPRYGSRNGNGAGNGNGYGRAEGFGSAAEDILHDLFGVKRRRSASATPRYDLRFDLQVSCEDVRRGATERIYYSRLTYCPACMNNGRRGPLPRCSHCHGAGELEEGASIEVTIPADCREGTRLRFAGAGDQPVPGMAAGDLVVLIHVVEG